MRHVVLHRLLIEEQAAARAIGRRILAASSMDDQAATIGTAEAKGEGTIETEGSRIWHQGTAGRMAATIIRGAGTLHRCAGPRTQLAFGLMARGLSS